jgi:predicted dehydrogenase
VTALSTRTVRFGILGAARIAPAALIKPAAKNVEASVEVVAARDSGRAAAYARKHRIPRVAASYEAVLADPELDAVYIPLPNGLHGRWTLAALAAGKHVLCEKPFTSNATEAAEVAEAARHAATASGLVTVEAFHYRYHPLAARMRQVIDDGELGRVRRVEAWLCAPIPNRADIRYQWDLAGGAMMDMGCYVVNMARLLGGEEPTVVSASAKRRGPDVDRAMSAQLTFPSGHTGAVHCSMWSSSLLHVEARVTGDEGTMRAFNPVAPQAFSWLTVRSARGRRREFPVRRSTYAYQLDAFCDSVLRGAPVRTTADDAVANMRVIDAVYEAAGMRPRGT